MTIEVLAELGETGIRISDNGLTYLEIYGPRGKLGHYFSKTWADADDMRSDLMQNHGGGGGVLIDVIERLDLVSRVGHCTY